MKKTIVFILIFVFIVPVFTGCSHTHEYKETVIKEPSCGEDGLKEFVCKKCGDSYSEAIPATGDHEYDENTVKEATCSAEGEKILTCRKCGHTETEVIPIDKNAHVFGSHKYTMAVSVDLPEDEWYYDQYGYLIKTRTPIVTFDCENVIKMPTATEEGEGIKTCELCGETVVVILPPIQ